VAATGLVVGASVSGVDTGAVVGAAVPWIGDDVGAVLGDSVGVFVPPMGAAVGPKVGAAVGPKVGEAVPPTLESPVGPAEGIKDRSTDGLSVGLSERLISMFAETSSSPKPR
jgi:hypothetical protein